MTAIVSFWQMVLCALAHVTWFKYWIYNGYWHSADWTPEVLLNLDSINFIQVSDQIVSVSWCYLDMYCYRTFMFYITIVPLQWIYYCWYTKLHYTVALFWMCSFYMTIGCCQIWVKHGGSVGRGQSNTEQHSLLVTLSKTFPVVPANLLERICPI